MQGKSHMQQGTPITNAKSHQIWTNSANQWPNNSNVQVKTDGAASQEEDLHSSCSSCHHHTTSPREKQTMPTIWKHKNTQSFQWDEPSQGHQQTTPHGVTTCSLNSNTAHSKQLHRALTLSGHWRDGWTVDSSSELPQQLTGLQFPDCWGWWKGMAMQEWELKTVKQPNVAWAMSPKWRLWHSWLVRETTQLIDIFAVGAFWQLWNHSAIICTIFYLRLIIKVRLNRALWW